MTPLELQHELNLFLEEKVAKEIKVKYVNSYGLETELNPTVFSGFLVPKLQNKNNADDISNKEYAHITTRIVDVQNDDEGVVATVKILIGIQSFDDNDDKSGIGYNEVWNLLERTRQEVLKQSVIGKKFKVKTNIKASMPEELYYPYWVGELTTLWELPVINEENLNFDF